MSPHFDEPSGVAPEPPSWLNSVSLPLVEHSCDALLYRVHRTVHDPIFFGPQPGKPPLFRFDPESGRFGVLYAAPGQDAALIETLLRQPQRRTVDFRDIAVRSLSLLKTSRDLRLVRAHSEGLSRIGTTAALATGPYTPCGRWTDALFDHPDRPDGILFASRHNPAEMCVALFEKEDYRVHSLQSIELPSLASTIGKVLDRHGKSLFGLSG